ncbi:hypothetical protein BFP97_18310 [Roseivirga sp. 4D4]|uniref:bleomycin resistance protein n=1 Tax=Roseivirga sp. 4D4 TaxID=1889784 RepID=UPI000852DF46|nr:VOC family protein [Roseivirga sp. 4D4]OEK03356.1 hypothetical protein BFP97_18310 [Roseivirga sp. 4D4]
MTNAKTFSHCSPIFPVPDVQETIDWYVANLGFQVDFKWEEPATYAVMSRDEIKIHFSQRDDDFTPSAVHTALYIFTYDVDNVFEEFKAKGIVTKGPETYDYGMRDFDLTDLNGFRLTFGQSVNH